MLFSSRASRLVPELSSDRLLMRQLTLRDETEWINLRYANTQWLEPWDPTSPLGVPEPMTFAQMIRAKNEAARDGSGFSWAIALPQLHQSRPPLIGQVSLSGIQYGAARSGSIGYWIDRSHAGFGLMPEACALVIDHCFESLELHRLEINIRPENEASLRVVEKLGFRDEGLRRGFLHINGAWADHRTFALNREELSTTMLERIYER